MNELLIDMSVVC